MYIFPPSAENPSISSYGIINKPRNLILDGGFQVWDESRSMPIVALTGYTGATMWSYITNAANQYTISRQPGITTNARYSMRLQRDAGSTNVNGVYLLFDMETENSIPLAGKELTLSCTVRAGANMSNPIVLLRLLSGTGTDQSIRTGYTGQTNFGQVVPSVSTTPARIMVRGLVPANATQVGVQLVGGVLGTAGAADYWEIENIQLELGPAPSNFQVANFGDLRNKINRYYYKTFPYDTAPAQGAAVAGSLRIVQYVVAGAAQNGPCFLFPGGRMRVAPVATMFNPNAVNAQVRNATIGVDCTASLFGSISEVGANPLFTTAVGSAVNNINTVAFTLDARL